MNITKGNNNDHEIKLSYTYVATYRAVASFILTIAKLLNIQLHNYRIHSYIASYVHYKGNWCNFRSYSFEYTKLRNTVGRFRVITFKSN